MSGGTGIGPAQDATIQAILAELGFAVPMGGTGEGLAQDASLQALLAAIGNTALPAGSLFVFDASRPGTLVSGGGAGVDGQPIIEWVGPYPALQGTAADQPTYDSLNLCGGPAVVFGSGGAPLYTPAQWLQAGAVPGATPFTYVVLARFDGANGVVFEHSINVVGNPGAFLNTSTGFSEYVTGPGGACQANVGASWALTNVPTAFYEQCDGTVAGQHIFENGGADLITARAGVDPGTQSTLVPLTIGARTGGISGFASGAIAFIGLWPYIFTPTQVAQLQSYFSSRWKIRTGAAGTTNLVGIGDSLMAGYYTQAANVDNTTYSFVTRAAVNLNAPAATILGYDGATLVTIRNNWLVHGPATLNPAVDNIVTCQGGLNDIAGGATATQTAANMQALVSAVRGSLNAIGGTHQKRIPVTTMGCNGNWASGSAQDNTRLAANAIIRANYQAWGGDYIVDPGADTPALENYSFFTGSGSIYNSDGGAHWSKTAQERACGLLLAPLRAAGF
jgi:hypothetical protein